MGDARVALVDLEEPYLGALRDAASRRGWESTLVHGELAAAPPARCVLAVVFGASAGTRCLERVELLKKSLPETPVIVLAEALPPGVAFRLAEAGATALLELPAPAPETAARCMERARPHPGDGLAELVGESDAMRELRAALAATAKTRSTVLITGETGTGKSLIARLIHRSASGGERPLVHVDCSALAPTVIESELFGHERGAFTGATHPRPGRFELAGEGDLFLDEIGELDLALQAKFLRALEEREFERVGGTRTLRMRARVIAATNRDLASELRAGRFRSDLYHRLRVVQLRVPPLRERPSDLPLLIEAVLARLAGQLRTPVPSVPAGFLDALAGYAWPGNVRELCNLVESALLMSPPGRLDAEHARRWLEPDARERAAAPEAPAVRGSAAERSELMQSLIEAGGNVARVARRMGMPRSTIRYKIQGYELDRFIPRD